jgi:hypothetical protein
METKQKARELVNKYNSLQVNFYKDQDPSYGYAKQCALIAVDEMYDVASENNNINQLNFLVDVKQEIINL